MTLEIADLIIPILVVKEAKKVRNHKMKKKSFTGLVKTYNPLQI
jgi:uncharacterized membrane protein